MRKELYSLESDKKRSSGIHSSFGSPSLSSHSSLQKFHNLNNKEPLNSISHDLSFKGSSYHNVSDVIKKFAEEFGKVASEDLEKKMAKASNRDASGLKWKNNSITFEQKSLGKRFVSLIVHNIVQLPLDIVNSALKTLKKIPIFKNSKNIDEILNTKILKDRREFLKNKSDVAAIEHIFEMMADKKESGKIFKEGHKRLNPSVSNYNTTAERTLTRIVTGMIPAFFLAKDAYNISMYMNNNKKAAKKEEERRFKQETIRIGTTAGLTFMVLNLFAKQSNSSAGALVGMTVGLTLVSEIVGRMMAGTPVLPVSKETAKKYAARRAKAEEKDEIKHKAKEDKKLAGQKASDVNHFKGSESNKTDKGKLTLMNALKVIGGLVLAGLIIDKTSNIKQVKKVLDDTNSKYKKFFKKDFNVSRDDFNKMILKLKENGFEEMAKKYEKLVAEQKGNKIKLGQEKNKVREFTIHQVLTFPIRFAWDTLMLPYKNIAKPLFNLAAGIKEVKPPKDEKKEAMEMLQNSYKFLKKIDKEPDYVDKVNKNILSSFDNLTKSSYSNANISTIVKTTASATTSSFLIFDNYSQVMIDSKGEKKELAEQKAKERTLQRAIRIVYGAFIIKLFNGVFSKAYNGSLLGAQAVNTASTFIVENMERKSVGMPTKESTRDEIIAIEKANLSAKGFKGSYFRFMAKLTGKKTLSEAAAIKEKKAHKAKAAV